MVTNKKKTEKYKTYTYKEQLMSITATDLGGLYRINEPTLLTRIEGKNEHILRMRWSSIDQVIE